MEQLSKSNRTILWAYLAMSLTITFILDGLWRAPYGLGTPDILRPLYQYLRFFQFISFLSISLILSISIVSQEKNNLRYIPLLFTFVLIFDSFFISKSALDISRYYGIGSPYQTSTWILSLATCASIVTALAKTQIKTKTLRITLLMFTIVVLTMGFELAKTIYMIVMLPNRVLKTFAIYDAFTAMQAMDLPIPVEIESYTRLIIGIVCISLFFAIGAKAYIQGTITVCTSNQ